MPDPVLATPDAPGTPAVIVDTPSAVDHAVAARDQGAYKAARHAERFGLEAPKVETPEKVVDDHPAASSAATPEPAPPIVPDDKPAASSAVAAPKPRVEARAAENRIPELLAENARLRALVEAGTKPTLVKSDVPAASSAAPTADPEPDASDLTKYPDGQFDRSYLKDLSLWGGREAVRAQQVEASKRETETQKTATLERRQREHVARVQTYTERCQAAQAIDPTLFDKIDPRLHELKSSMALAEGQSPTFGHILADAILAAENPVGLMLAVSQPGEADRLSTLPYADLLMAIGQIKASLQPITPASPKTVTDAPDPAPTLGKRPTDTADPIESAIRRGDQAAYKAARHNQRLAALKTA